MNIDWAGFLPVMIVLTLLPGADVTIVVRQTIKDGRGAAAATALGVNVGCFCWAAAFAVGLVGLLRASAGVYETVKLAGAAYLIVLGLLSLRAAVRRRPAEPDLPSEDLVRPGSSRAWAGFRIGLFTNLLNPKIGLFYAAMLPQFLDPAGSVLGQAMLMTLAWNACAFVWLGLVAWGVARAGTALTHGRGKRVVDAVSGTFLCVIGARVARGA